MSSDQINVTEDIIFVPRPRRAVRNISSCVVHSSSYARCFYEKVP